MKSILVNSNAIKEQLIKSKLDLVVAGTKDAVLMVESEANVLSEDIMLGAVVYGHEQMQVVVDSIVRSGACHHGVAQPGRCHHGPAPTHFDQNALFVSSAISPHST